MYLTKSMNMSLLFYIVFIVSISVCCLCNDELKGDIHNSQHTSTRNKRKLGWLDINSPWPLTQPRNYNSDSTIHGQSTPPHTHNPLHSATLHTSASGQAGISMGGKSRQVDGQMQQLINQNCIGQQGMLGSQKQKGGDQDQSLHSMQQKVCLDGTIQQDFGHQNQKQGGEGDGLQQQAHKQELDLGSHKLTQVGAQQQMKSDEGIGQQQQGLLQGITEKHNQREYGGANGGNANIRHEPHNDKPVYKKPPKTNYLNDMSNSYRNKPSQGYLENPNRPYQNKPNQNKPYQNKPNQKKPYYPNKNDQNKNYQNKNNQNKNYQNKPPQTRGQHPSFNGSNGMFPTPDFSSGFGNNPLFSDPYYKKNKHTQDNKVHMPFPGFGNQWGDSDAHSPPFAYGRVDDSPHADVENTPPTRYGSAYNNKRTAGGHSTFPPQFANMYPQNSNTNAFQNMPMGMAAVGPFGPF